MARISAADRVAKGAGRLDKRLPGWVNGSAVTPWGIDMWDGQRFYRGFDQVLFLARRGLTDAAAEEHGLAVPHFDASDHSEHQEKRQAFADRLTNAWRALVFGRKYSVGAIVRGQVVMVYDHQNFVSLCVRDQSGIVQCLGFKAELCGQQLQNLLGVKSGMVVCASGTLRQDQWTPGGYLLTMQAVEVLSGPSALVLL